MLVNSDVNDHLLVARKQLIIMGRGQRTRILLWQSEFEWSLEFFVKCVLEKTENKQKEDRVGPFKKTIYFQEFELLHEMFIIMKYLVQKVAYFNFPFLVEKMFIQNISLQMS